VIEPRPAYPIRVATEADWPDWVWVNDQSFGVTNSPGDNTRERAVHEFDRSLGAYDGDTLVGTTAIYSLRMSLPGGVHPVAGVTWVGVLPSYRRRGVLTALMRAQLDDLHERGAEPVAALWASEPAIYGRFGYGAASRHLALTIPRGDVLAPAAADPSLVLRLARDGGLTDVESVRRRVVPRRPGLFEHDERWAARAAGDPPEHRRGASELRCVLACDEDGVRGYARYATRTRWELGVPKGVAVLRDLQALDPAAYSALWRFVTDLDLTTALEVRHRPVDDPLLELLVGVSAARPTVGDGLFVRLVDLDRALARRTYSAPVDVVLEVTDRFCPWNAGRWRLEGDPSGARCTPTEDPPDLSLTSTDLGAVYLGGGSLQRLALAGRVREVRHGALAPASAAFRHDPAPVCDEIF
jgi:predicted acetyltransferase